MDFNTYCDMLNLSRQEAATIIMNRKVLSDKKLDNDKLDVIRQKYLHGVRYKDIQDMVSDDNKLSRLLHDL